MHEVEKHNSCHSLKYFGYDIFKRDPLNFQLTSYGAVDPDYLIGPDDEIIVMLWGETQFRQVLKVDREGFVFIPDVGQVFVNGLNLNLLESKLFKILSQIYSSLSSSGKVKASTFLDVSLGNLRPLRVQVIGEVDQPGIYTVSPSATLSSSLYYFNGPNTLGTLRDIKLIRRGKEITSIDFYDYLLNGKNLRDANLQLDDVVFIPKRLKTVSIKGEINRSGIYELKDGETLTDLLEIAGGLKSTAYLNRSQINRIVPFKKRSELGMGRMFIDTDLGQVLNNNYEFDLYDGDIVEIFSIFDFYLNTVSIEGSIGRPGEYDVAKSPYLLDLINNADSLLGDAYLDRLDIIRKKPDSSEEIIRLNLVKVLENDPNHNIRLNPLDRVRVYSLSEMIDKEFVIIEGHIKKPGRYSLKDNMTLNDLIFISGSFIDENFKSNTYLDRADIIMKVTKNGKAELISFNFQDVLEEKEGSNILLMDKDVVKIYSRSEIVGGMPTVSLLGHAKQTGPFDLYEENMTIHDLLFMYGGFEDLLFQKTVYLNRADLIRYDELTNVKKYQV